jgi:hypothetical protein
MMSLLRSYLLDDAQMLTLLDNQEAIYQVEKPKEMEHDTYIVFLSKPLQGGHIKDYQIEFRLIDKNLSKLNALQSRLITLLDNPRERLILNDENTVIRDVHLLNGGGTLKNPSTDNFETIVFFLCRV